MRAPKQAVSVLRGAARELAPWPLLATAALPQPSSSRLAVAQPPFRRLLSSSPPTFAAPPTKSSSTTPNDPPKPTGPIRDDAILALSQYVRLVDPNTGSLAGPFSTSAILTKLDRSKFFLQQVAPAQPHRSTVPYDPSSPPSSVDVSKLVQFPICRLIDKKEEFDRVRNAKRASAATPSHASTSGGGSSSKEVQLTWSVSPNDLAHKLSKARKEMLRGARINVVVTTKSGGRRYVKGLNVKEDERREALLREIEQFLCKPAEESVAEAEDKPGPIARRLQDVDWQRGGSAAVMSFECFRTK